MGIFDYGTADDGAFYYVMEYLPVMDLSQIVKCNSSLLPARTAFHAPSVCGPGRGSSIELIHRDVKPANIIAAQRGGLYDVAKLLGFRISEIGLHA